MDLELDAAVLRQTLSAMFSRAMIFRRLMIAA
jgi:hypothetical protein